MLNQDEADRRFEDSVFTTLEISVQQQQNPFVYPLLNNWVKI